MNDSYLAALRKLLGDAQVSNDPAQCFEYGRDWTRIHEPAPLAVVFPHSTEDVVAIVKFAREHGIALVPSGGRTGLSGAAVACNGELVVSFDRMNHLRDFDAVNRSVVCEAGVITEQLQTFAEEQGLFYPVDFASSGSSQIGGNIGTNAGGIKVIRYGLTRDWVAGLKVVTGTGEVLELNHGLVKNATGYDLRQLFIGSEGTLGFVTEATMRLTRPPQNLTVLVLGTPEFESMMSILHAFSAEIDLTAFEFFSEPALRKVIARHELQRPFDTEAPYYALLEFEAPVTEIADTALNIFERCLEQGWVLDGVMSQNQTQARNLWRLREDISESISEFTPYKNDISVTVSRVPAFLQDVEALVNEQYPDFELIWFGHIGDGNLHLNILKPETLEKADFFTRCHKASEQVFAIVERHRGSISAEHGVGLTKKDYLHYSRSAGELAAMLAMKQVFDPDGIMNPGKVFDA